MLNNCKKTKSQKIKIKIPIYVFAVASPLHELFALSPRVFYNKICTVPTNETRKTSTSVSYSRAWCRISGFCSGRPCPSSLATISATETSKSVLNPECLWPLGGRRRSVLIVHYKLLVGAALHPSTKYSLNGAKS